MRCFRDSRRERRWRRRAEPWWAERRCGRGGRGSGARTSERYSSRGCPRRRRSPGRGGSTPRRRLTARCPRWKRCPAAPPPRACPGGEGDLRRLWSSRHPEVEAARAVLGIVRRSASLGGSSCRLPARARRGCGNEEEGEEEEERCTVSKSPASSKSDTRPSWSWSASCRSCSPRGRWCRASLLSRMPRVHPRHFAGRRRRRELLDDGAREVRKERGLVAGQHTAAAVVVGAKRDADASRFSAADQPAFTGAAASSPVSSARVVAARSPPPALPRAPPDLE